MNMKKLVLLLTALVILATLTACGGNNSNDGALGNNQTPDNAVPPNTDITDKFTDPAFLACVREEVGKNEGESILASDVKDISFLNVSEKDISSLNGIEFLVSLRHLDCVRNKLTELDVSKNIALTALFCDMNQLTALDVSKNVKLEALAFEGNQLTEIDLTNNTALEHIYCIGNQLTQLDLSKNTALKTIRLRKNQLKKLDVSNNIELKELDCIDTPLTKENITGLDEARTTLRIN